MSKTSPKAFERPEENQGDNSHTPETERPLFKVVRIPDGDTITVREDFTGQERTVRLAFIDAPEKSQASIGSKSRIFLEQLIENYGGRVSLIIHGEDPYGRLVAEVFSDKLNLNLQMVDQGMALVYSRYLEKAIANKSISDVTYQGYIEAETKAKYSHKGVWGIENFQNPEDYRAAQRRAKEN